MKSIRLCAAASLAAACLMALLAAKSGQAQTYTEKVLHSFKSSPDDGRGPFAGLIRDAKGNLFGTTPLGGNITNGCGGECGVVFKISSTGNETVLYHFTGGTDGSNPHARLIQDTNGNLYGTTSVNASGYGTVFKLNKTTGKETVLYSFTGGADGYDPEAGLVRDAAGNLYGTTLAGGTHFNGVVFKLDTNNQETVLYSFTGGADGGGPEAGVIQDGQGNFYGTTHFGGDLSCGSSGCGVVFKIDTSGNETVLYSFTGGTDGATPSGVIRDTNGNLYGTTSLGGGPSCQSGYGCGVVFKLSNTRKYTVLYSFCSQSACADGANPGGAGVIRDTNGNLYGTTNLGGDVSCNNPYGCGTVFKLSNTRKYTVLYSFTGDVNGKGADGVGPAAGVIRDANGNLYGTTLIGGDLNVNDCNGFGCGVVFKLTP